MRWITPITIDNMPRQSGNRLVGGTMSLSQLIEDIYEQVGLIELARSPEEIKLSTAHIRTRLAAFEAAEFVQSGSAAAAILGRIKSERKAESSRANMRKALEKRWKK
jgi:hypothetical protein